MNFDYCAKEYFVVYDTLSYQHVDEPTLLEMCGDLTGKSVLDVGCGDGKFSRRLGETGASRVVGCDLSAEMIALAERANPHDHVHFQVADATQFDLQEKFDVVVASLLLSLAADRTMLNRMVASLVRHLQPDGKLIIMDDNVFLDPQFYAATRKYGFSKSLVDTEELTEGCRLEFFIHGAGDDSVQVLAYHHSRTTWEEAFRANGLAHIQYWKPRVAVGPGDSCPEDFFNDYVSLPINNYLLLTLGTADGQ